MTDPLIISKISKKPPMEGLDIELWDITVSLDYVPVLTTVAHSLSAAAALSAEGVKLAVTLAETSVEAPEVENVGS